MSKSRHFVRCFEKNNRHGLYPEKFPAFISCRLRIPYSETISFFVEIEKLRENLKKISDSSELNDKDKFLAFKKTENEILDLRNKAVEANIGLVIEMACAFFPMSKQFSNLNFFDLFQEGIIGLLTAADRFDYKKGFQFSTYAVWWIRTEIHRAIFNHSIVVRLPIYIYEIMGKAREAAQKFKKEFKRAPKKSELSKLTGIAEKDIKRAAKAEAASRKTFSLSDPFLLEENMLDSQELFEQYLSVEDAVIQQEIIKKIKDFLDNNYSADKARALKVRLFTDESLSEAGKILKISRERMRQIESEVLEKLSFELNNNKI